jgi:hypothetical protein
LEHLEHNWDRQREQLSALLDDELDEEERADLEAHLPTCAACRAELESLRRARALVRALPQPTLPRNFALPLAAAPMQAASTARPAPASARRPASAPPARIANRRPVHMLQWFSTIAAVLGFILLCSSAFSSLHFGGGAATGAASRSAQTNGGQPAPAASPSSGTINTKPDQPTPVSTAPKPTAAPENGEHGTGSVHRPSDSSSQSPAGLLLSIPGLGALLLILSVVGFTAAWWLRRRW